MKKKLMKINNIQIEMLNKLIDDVEVEDKIQLYKDNNSNPFILKLLDTQKRLSNPKLWGCFLEQVAQNLLGLDDSINTEHDKIHNTKKIEIKSSTMLSSDLLKNKYTFQYNSVRLDYDYDYLLLQNINFNTIDYYIISKENLKEISKMWSGQKSYKKNIITMINFKDIKDYVIEITDKNISNIIK